MIVKIVIAVVAVALLGALAGFAWSRFRPKALNTSYYQEKWQELQKMLRDKTKWPEAIMDADKLLDEALKNRHVRGGNMGARLVKAQRMFTDNDGLWFAHKLRNKIDAEPDVKLKESDVKQALLGTRQALKDVGALPNGQPTDTK
jgi:hypothetical protein